VYSHKTRRFGGTIPISRSDVNSKLYRWCATASVLLGANPCDPASRRGCRPFKHRLIQW
jgi:hypothetical protein